MATIRKRGRKYEVQFRRKGFPTSTRSFHRLVDARQWAALIETKADRQELEPDRKILDQHTLGDLVRRYRDTVVPIKKSAETEVITLNAFLRDPICLKRLSEVNATDFASYRDRRLNVVKPATLKRQLNPIRHMFRHAREEWDIPVRSDLLGKVRFKNADNRRKRRLREGESELIVKSATAARNPIVISVVLFALQTAMRRGEILALRWCDIDLSRHSVTIVEAKNGYSRTIPLTPKASEILKEMLKLRDNKTDTHVGGSGNSANEEGDGSTNIAGNSDDSPVFQISGNALRLSWVRLCNRANLVDLHFHDLRHEAISRLFELGLTVPEVASISGHRDMTMLFRYAHADQGRLREKLGISQALARKI